jgi:hypothetical protein
MVSTFFAEAPIFFQKWFQKKAPIPEKKDVFAPIFWKQFSRNKIEETLNKAPEKAKANLAD